MLLRSGDCWYALHSCAKISSPVSLRLFSLTVHQPALFWSFLLPISHLCSIMCKKPWTKIIRQCFAAVTEGIQRVLSLRSSTFTASFCWHCFYAPCNGLIVYTQSYRHTLSYVSSFAPVSSACDELVNGLSKWWCTVWLMCIPWCDL